MAGKFINTTQKVIIDSLVESYKDRLKNPYYTQTDKKATIVTYYNINKAKSTLDEGLKIEYSRLGKDSPLRFNRIHNFFVYGLERITTQLENGDYGIVASDIEGEAIILPNTIEPLPNDYFTINYLNDTLLFKVTGVTFDTIENDANFWKITYKLDRMEDTDILDQISDEFEMIVNNVGTQYKSIIRKKDYDFIDKLELIIDRIKEYYNSLFYNERVQTYTFQNLTKRFYDPYMIEFLIRNDVLTNDGRKYIYIGHQTILSNKFDMEYDKTFFRFLEMPDITGRRPRYTSQATYIDQLMCIFSDRPEEYFEVHYIDDKSLVNYSEYIIENFSHELIDNIFSNKKFEGNDYRNIIIKYFYNEKLNADDIDSLNNIDFDDTIEYFYNIPILLYALDSNIKELLKTYK